MNWYKDAEAKILNLVESVLEQLDEEQQELNIPEKHMEIVAKKLVDMVNDAVYDFKELKAETEDDRYNDIVP